MHHLALALHAFTGAFIFWLGWRAGRKSVQ
jgi:hypothetical protein